MGMFFESFKNKMIININLPFENKIYKSHFGLRKSLIVKQIVNNKLMKNKSSFENQSLKILKKYNLDLLCLAGFMKILSGSFIKKFYKPILNIHPSLLPKYKGLNTHLRAIKNKEKFAGATVHKVNRKLDSGKIILQKKVKILKKDSVKSLKKKVLMIEHEIYSKAIEKFLTNL